MLTKLWHTIYYTVKNAWGRLYKIYRGIFKIFANALKIENYPTFILPVISGKKFVLVNAQKTTNHIFMASNESLRYTAIISK